MTIGKGLAILVVMASVAHAQQPASPAAESLFREGKQLLKGGDIPGACNKFQASEELEQSVGTELNLADCREQNGEIATAWAIFLKAATNAKAKKDPKRATEAKRRAKLLEGKLVYLTIKVSERVEGLAITRNDFKVDEAEWDQRVPIDPGEYTIDVKAPGRSAWSKHITIGEKNRTIDVPALAEEAAPTDEPRPKRKKKKAPPPPAVETTTGRRHAGLTYTLGVLGIAGLGAGVGFGLRARSLSGDADDRCPNQACLDPVALDQNDRAHGAAVFANLGFAVGGAALIGATISWLTGRPAKVDHVTFVPVVRGDSVGFAVGGRL